MSGTTTTTGADDWGLRTFCWVDQLGKPVRSVLAYDDR